MVKCLFFLICLTGMTALLPAQDVRRISLQEAQEKAKQHYPVTRQQELVKRTADITVDNLRKSFLPQLSFNGQATYQSDVTHVSLSLPGISIQTPSKDQYKALADLSQLLYDGGITREQQKLAVMNAGLEQQKIEVELHQLRDRVNQVCLGILYLDEQLKLAALVAADIQTGIKRVDAQIRNGVAFRSSLSMLKAEWLRAEQRTTELQSARKGWVDVLGLFTGESFPADLQLEMPAALVTPSEKDTSIRRPELQLYARQSELAVQQDRLSIAKNRPKASLFAQGGYGRPGLNMLSNDFDFYYIGGLRLNWSLGGLYTRKKEKEQVEVNKQIVDVQRETFLLNVGIQLKQQQAEIDKFNRLLATDDTIITLRHSVTEAARAQLENGVITASDYIREVNAEDQARQNRAAHSVQLLQARINYQTISGNEY